MRFEELVDKQGDYITRKEFKEAIGRCVKNNTFSEFSNYVHENMPTYDVINEKVEKIWEDINSTKNHMNQNFLPASEQKRLIEARVKETKRFFVPNEEFKRFAVETERLLAEHTTKHGNAHYKTVTLKKECDELSNRIARKCEDSEFKELTETVKTLPRN